MGRKQVDTMAVTMRVHQSLIKKIDDWRRKQDDLPTRTEAMRRLIEMSIDNE